MATITEAEFRRITDGLLEDRHAIIGHNPIGTPSEIMLWMLMSCLISYLSLSDSETPCFTGRADERVYREAIAFILRDRKSEEFDETPYLDKLAVE